MALALACQAVNSKVEAVREIRGGIEGRASHRIEVADDSEAKPSPVEIVHVGGPHDTQERN